MLVGTSGVSILENSFDSRVIRHVVVAENRIILSLLVLLLLRTVHREPNGLFFYFFRRTVDRRRPIVLRKSKDRPEDTRLRAILSQKTSGADRNITTDLSTIRTRD